MDDLQMTLVLLVGIPLICAMCYMMVMAIWLLMALAFLPVGFLQWAASRISG